MHWARKTRAAIECIYGINSKCDSVLNMFTSSVSDVSAIQTSSEMSFGIQCRYINTLVGP